ncbi:hypothetical protein HAX54_047878, partial [Datura stramonium]|nr:hypothetical protein [Datura stramonium]
KLMGFEILKLNSEDLTSSSNEDLLEDILGAGKDNDDEDKKECHIENPPESPTMTSSIPSALVAPRMWNHPSGLWRFPQHLGTL